MTRPPATFVAWLLRRRGVSGPTGEIARFITRAPGIGLIGDRRLDLRHWCEENNASPEMLEAFDRAWDIYLQERTPHR